MGSVGEGEGGLICEKSTETYTLPYVKQITSVSFMHDSGYPKLVLCDNLEGWGGEGDGRGFKVEGTRTDGRFTLMYGKSDHNVVK